MNSIHNRCPTMDTDHSDGPGECLIRTTNRKSDLPTGRMGSTVNLTVPDGEPRLSSAVSGSNIVLSRLQNRLVNKDGSYLIEHSDPPDVLKKYWRNAFHMVLEIKWRYVWFFVFTLFPLSWLVFAICFYGLAYAHGDFQDHSKSNETFTPCVTNANGFVSMLLFSIESQETIGYGYRYSTEECGVLLVLLSIQYVAGAVLQACLCAIIWARMLRPKRRGQEVIFSKTACIQLNDDGDLCLMFRLSDIFGTHLVQSGIRMYMAKKQRVPNSKDLFSFNLYHMQMGEDCGRDKVFFLWPTVAYHIINQQSPLYNYSMEEFEKSDLEFIAVAEGIVESTGLTVQTRTSYLSSEVLWGYKFQPMNFCEKTNKSKVKVQYKDFDATYKVDTPKCSAKELDAIKRELQALDKKETENSTFKYFFGKPHSAT